MDSTNVKGNSFSLTEVISTAIQIPGVKVDRDAFLREQFRDVSNERLKEIIEKGPVEAKCSRSELQKKAYKIINDRTIASTGASFLAGIPGGLAMAATIPADMLQFYAVALRMAQEIGYLYGESDLWDRGIVDKDKVTNQLILYCGVMLGASGASQTIRLLSASLAKQALKKLPQQALTKTFYYPIIKSIVIKCGGNMSKKIFSQGVAKVIPVIGGVVSGGVTFASMMPMGRRLADTLDDAHFSYTKEEFQSDWHDVMQFTDSESDQGIIDVDTFGLADKVEEKGEKQERNTSQGKNVLEEIKKAKDLLDIGIISEEEFIQIKTKLISEM